MRNEYKLVAELNDGRFIRSNYSNYIVILSQFGGLELILLHYFQFSSISFDYEFNMCIECVFIWLGHDCFKLLLLLF